MCDTCSTTSPSPSPVGRRALLGAAAGMPALGVATGTAASEAAGPRRRPHRVLVFSRTTGFRHNSIPIAIRTVEELCTSRGILTVATEDPQVFTDRGLSRFTAIVFANTTGNVLDARQRAAFERFVTGGGGWVGIHSAADTEYTSDFYTRLLAGGRFLAHPLEQPGVVVRESARHLSTKHLAKRWPIPIEEFYSFTSSVRGRSEVLLSIDESTYAQDPNTSNLPTGPENPFPGEGVSGVMGDHPMCWQHRVGRGLAWYTALGHEITMYLDPTYRTHLLGGLLTASRHGHTHLR